MDSVLVIDLIKLRHIVVLCVSCHMGVAPAEEAPLEPSGAPPPFASFAARALAADPLTEGSRQRAHAQDELAKAAKSLPDPIVQLGYDGTAGSADTGADQESMSKVIIGLQQAFPPLGSLRAKSSEYSSQAAAQEAATRNREMQVLRAVREQWLDLYYQFQAGALAEKMIRAFQDLEKITQLRYRSGRGNQYDVVQAQLELSLLKDLAQSIESDRGVALAQLASWVGVVQLDWKSPVEFPPMPTVPPYEQLRSGVSTHPSLEMAEWQVSAKRANVDAARSTYFPETMFSVNYGIQDATQADTFGAMLSFSLPILPPRRQSRWLDASRAELEGAKTEVDEQRRRLNEMLDSEFQRWKVSDDRYRHFESTVLPHSVQYAQSTLKSYQAGVATFDVVVRARLAELDNSLKALRVQVDRGKAQARILYLAGDAKP